MYAVRAVRSISLKISGTKGIRCLSARPAKGLVPSGESLTTFSSAGLKNGASVLLTCKTDISVLCPISHHSETLKSSCYALSGGYFDKHCHQCAMPYEYSLDDRCIAYICKSGAHVSVEMIILL